MVDIGDRIDRGTVEGDVTGVVGRDVEILDFQRRRRFVDNIDPCITRRIDLSGTGAGRDLTSAEKDVAELNGDVIELQEETDPHRARRGGRTHGLHLGVENGLPARNRLSLWAL